jgi:hypothetical protein
MPNYLSKVVELNKAQRCRALQSVQTWARSSSAAILGVRRSVTCGCDAIASRCAERIVRGGLAPDHRSRWRLMDVQCVALSRE